MSTFWNPHISKICVTTQDGEPNLLISVELSRIGGLPIY